jgi:hypothetical protein
MPNRLVSVKYNNHTCFIHLYFDQNKMDVNVLDQQLREELQVSSFTIDNKGQLVTDDSSALNMNTPAVRALYTTIIQQQPEAVNSFSLLR